MDTTPVLKKVIRFPNPPGILRPTVGPPTLEDLTYIVSVPMELIRLGAAQTSTAIQAQIAYEEDKWLQVHRRIRQGVLFPTEVKDV
jgi:hypothetical protein